MASSLRLIYVTRYNDDVETFIQRVHAKADDLARKPGHHVVTIRSMPSSSEYFQQYEILYRMPLPDEEETE